jgi:hypothetical protein
MTEAIETTPAPIETKLPFAASENPAVARSVNAWVRVHKAELAKGRDRYDSKKAANRAYLDAMPPLSGDENIRDFIACVTHAIISDIMRDDTGAKLLYAAQVAHTTSRGQSKAPKTAASL